MATIVSGLLGGLLGAVVTGAATSVLVEDPRPSAVVWAMYFGDGDPSHYGIQGVVVHLLYGTVAGGLFVGLARLFSLALSTLSGTVLWALAWAGVLAVVALVFWSKVAIGDDLDSDSIAVQSAAHLGYGLVLGCVAYIAGGL